MIIDELAQYAVDQVKSGLSPEVSHAAKRALVDWFSALFPGTQVQPATSLMQAHAHELGVGRASLPGSRPRHFRPRRHGSTAACLTPLSSTTSTGTPSTTPDAPRWPLRWPWPNTCSVRAASAGSHHCGYEISTRIGVAVQPSHYKYFHTTGTVGCFGGAAAAAVLLSPLPSVTAHALATSATFASGLQQAFRSEAMTKALHAGHAAWVGVTSAFGADKGLTGVLDILEGSAGFGAALANGPDWSKATDGLGSRFNIQSVTVKNHGCCGHTFASIDGLLALRQQHGFDMQAIERIEIRTYAVAVEVAGIRAPQSPFECKFSIPYVVSHAAKYGSVRLAAFDTGRIFEEDLRALMPHIQLEADSELTSKFPNMRAARVRVHLKSGQVLEHFQPYRIGDPEAPLTDEQISEKFLELASPVISDRAAKQLLDRLWSIDQEADIRALNLQGL